MTRTTPARTTSALATLLLGPALLLSGCRDSEPAPVQPDPSDHHLARFSSCTELKSYVGDAWLEQLVQSRYGGYYGWGLDEGDAGSDGGGSDAPSDFSETNVQEVGVDEPDLVKTEDGTHLYVAHGRRLSVVKSWPAEETGIVGELELDAVPFALFLDGDRALVLANAWEYSDGDSKTEPETGPSDDGDDPDSGEDREGSAYDSAGDVPDWSGASDRWYRYSTKALVVDVSDPTAPDLLREIDVEGWYVDARMIDGDVYLVTKQDSWAPEDLWELLWSDAVALPEVDDWSDEEALAAAADRARDILRPYVVERLLPMEVAELLPEYRDQLPGEDADPALLTECTDVYHPDEASSPGVLTVTHLDLGADDDGSALSATGLMAEGWEVYASADNLYIAQTSWWWWWGWSDLDLTTRIHKFELSGADTTYAASGEVEGWLLNRYSMGEHDGYLRVATTDINWWWGGGADEDEPANNVFVLGEAGDGDLEVVGEVGGIAPGEQIYSARFMGDRGYLVTFEQVDPFFTLDLSNPTDPTVVGELKVTGYSSYLHPVDEDHVLSVGMEATEEGVIEGFAVSLFDISDFADPKLADRYLLESDDWSWSEALWDPHAFTYHRDTLSVPAYTYDYDESDGSWEEFSGLLVLDVDLDGGDAGTGALAELGRVEHTALAAATECPDDPYDDCYDYDGGWTWMRRSVVIEDWLYSISTHGLAVSELRTPENVVAEVPWYPAE